MCVARQSNWQCFTVEVADGLVRADVNDDSFTVEAHTLTVIVGTSGSGKTTLLRMMISSARPSVNNAAAGFFTLLSYLLDLHITYFWTDPLAGCADAAIAGHSVTVGNRGIGRATGL